MGDYGVHCDYSNRSSKNMFATGLMQVSSKVGLAVGIALGLASVCGWWYSALLRRSEAKNSNKKSPLPPGRFGFPLVGETSEYQSTYTNQQICIIFHFPCGQIWTGWSPKPLPSLFLLLLLLFS
jgi:hypothetical protein